MTDFRQKLRNTLRFIIGNCGSLQGGSDSHLPLASRRPVLDRLATLMSRSVKDEIMEMYKVFNFSTAISTLERYIQEDLSAFYLDAIKNRLYLPPRSDPLRQSAISALQSIYADLLVLTRPITPYLAAEVAEHFGEHKDPPAVDDFPKDKEGFQTTWAGLRAARSQAHQFIKTLISQG